MTEFHVPVMVDEVLRFLDPHPGETFIDCTIGGAGHAIEILKRITPNGKLLGIDKDEEALAVAAKKLASFAENLVLVQGSFADLEAIARDAGVESADGILFDLGVSSKQLDSEERGFSFRYDAPLDMRMDRRQRLTAKELVNSLSERRLAELIREYGEERWAKRIAKSIVNRRQRRPIETTFDLVETILAAIPAQARSQSIHPATRTFMALRIAVNREFEALEQGLEAGIRLLRSGGRLVVLSYHSLEDRIVKETFNRHTARCMCPASLPVCACGAKKDLEILTKRPLTPTKEEVLRNPRARSAKLRAAKKI